MKFSTKLWKVLYFKASVKKTRQIFQESQKNKNFENSRIPSNPSYSPWKSLSEIRTQFVLGTIKFIVSRDLFF